MPNNRAYGMFEDLLSASLNDDVRKYTEAVVSKAKTDQIATYRDSHFSKAVIRSYTAWQDPPDIQYIGQSIRNGYSLTSSPSVVASYGGSMSSR